MLHCVGRIWIGALVGVQLLSLSSCNSPNGGGSGGGTSSELAALPQTPASQETSLAAVSTTTALGPVNERQIKKTLRNVAKYEKWKSLGRKSQSQLDLFYQKKLETTFKALYPTLKREEAMRQFLADYSNLVTE